MLKRISSTAFSIFIIQHWNGYFNRMQGWVGADDLNKQRPSGPLHFKNSIGGNMENQAVTFTVEPTRGSAEGIDSINVVIISN